MGQRGLADFADRHHTNPRAGEGGGLDPINMSQGQGGFCGLAFVHPPFTPYAVPHAFANRRREPAPVLFPKKVGHRAGEGAEGGVHQKGLIGGVRFGVTQSGAAEGVVAGFQVTGCRLV